MNQIVIAILNDINDRLERAIDNLEDQLPDDMAEKSQNILGDVSIDYPITNELWDLSHSIKRMLDNLRGE